LCDDEGPTLTIIKSNYEKIFGGFTDISWLNTGAGKKGNGNTFIFSVQEDKTIKKFKSIVGKTEIFQRDN